MLGDLQCVLIFLQGAVQLSLGLEDLAEVDVDLEFLPVRRRLVERGVLAGGPVQVDRDCRSRFTRTGRRSRRRGGGRRCGGLARRRGRSRRPTWRRPARPSAGPSAARRGIVPPAPCRDVFHTERLMDKWLAASPDRSHPVAGRSPLSHPHRRREGRRQREAQGRGLAAADRIVVNVDGLDPHAARIRRRPDQDPIGRPSMPADASVVTIARRRDSASSGWSGRPLHEDRPGPGGQPAIDQVESRGTDRRELVGPRQEVGMVDREPVGVCLRDLNGELPVDI